MHYKYLEDLRAFPITSYSYSAKLKEISFIYAYLFSFLLVIWPSFIDRDPANREFVQNGFSLEGSFPLCIDLMHRAPFFISK